MHRTIRTNTADVDRNTDAGGNRRRTNADQTTYGISRPCTRNDRVTDRHTSLRTRGTDRASSRACSGQINHGKREGKLVVDIGTFYCSAIYFRAGAIDRYRKTAHRLVTSHISSCTSNHRSPTGKEVATLVATGVGNHGAVVGEGWWQKGDISTTVASRYRGYNRSRTSDDRWLLIFHRNVVGTSSQLSLAVFGRTGDGGDALVERYG